MSATNRHGAPRRRHDDYETPPWLTRAIVPILFQHMMVKPRILEPACGKGTMVAVLGEAFPHSKIDAFDLYFGPVNKRRNFLTAKPRPIYDLIITNPPFAHAREFVDRAMLWRRTPQSIVAMIFRLNFLGAQERAVWWRTQMPSGIYVTPKRPMFSVNKHGKLGSDAAEYGWFVWGPRSEAGTIVEILPTEGLSG